ncbi:MAG: TetR family transcriptional regulator [Blautia sp.]|nr:TetR family transcriptional regulator [Blautia sp.]
MPNTTRQIIARTLIDLLKEKPVAKITVKDIVEHCGVNRNTFYYHFRDIPDVVDFAMREELDRLLAGNVKARSFPELFFNVIAYLTDHRREILHIYNSLARDSFLRYLHSIADYTTRQALGGFTGDSGLSEKEFETTCFTCRCFLEGILLDWLDHDMNYDLLSRLKDSGKLLTDKWDILLMAAYSGKTDR